MMRASAGVGRALTAAAVVSVFSVIWGATVPAQADVGGVVGTVAGAGEDATSGVVGGVVGPTASSVTDPVSHAAAPITHAAAPVTHAADPVTHALADPVATVQKATQPHAPVAPPDAATTSTTRAAGTSAAVKPPRGSDHSSAASRAASTAASTADGADRRADRKAHRRAHSRRADRDRPSGTPDMLRASALGRALLLSMLPPAGRRQAAGVSDANAAQACRSASLTPSDLLRCARVDALLPNLGGPRTVLLPVSLALITVGLVMVARGRRRHGPSVHEAL